jgi:hypothetical protein
MDEHEIRYEAARFSVIHDDDVEILRLRLKDALERRWLEDNRESIAAMNAWVEKYGLPLERYRCW